MFLENKTNDTKRKYLLTHWDIFATLDYKLLYRLRKLLANTELILICNNIKIIIYKS